ncbi:unnamed protein product [Didymodactylos carnosus]|uniref:Uncharacterized protein n=1 Tax=Didymodactylos carnosus TaxID=1234261 RepID=A0A8S2F9R2_9BILA|nr:unnamed protein product [Didymodactylos carnosus]CAF4202870.1 unnamed protein product [Didymodactylos carnosus]
MLATDVEKIIIQEEVYFTDKEELKKEFIRTAQSNQCSLDMQMYEQDIPIIVPNALVPDVDLHWHQVDVIAVFTNSDELRQSVLNAAGTAVEHEYQSQQQTPHTATKYAFEKNYTSIAFSASATDDSDQSLRDIAAGMISGSVESLQEYKSQSLSISFVLHQQTVYDAFFTALNRRLAKNDGPPIQDQSKMAPIDQIFDDLNLPLPTIFNQQMVHLILTSSVENRDNLPKCAHEIEEICKKRFLRLVLDNKTDVREWSTKHVKTYYKFCLRRHVLPQLDIENAKIELQGPADGVRDAEIHFYEQCNDALKQTKLPDVREK